MHIFHEYFTGVKSEAATGQLLASSHYNRFMSNYFAGETTKFTGWGLSLDFMYYDNPFNGPNYMNSRYTPYVTSKQNTAGWDALTDPNFPRPKMGQAEKVVSKYQNLSDSTWFGLLMGEAYQVNSAVSVEIHPYWERMMLDSLLRDIAGKKSVPLSGSKSAFDTHYFESGLTHPEIAPVVNMNPEQFDAKTVFFLLNSLTFMKLSEADKFSFMTLTTVNQVAFTLLESVEQKAAFLAQHAGEVEILNRKVSYYTLDPKIGVSSRDKSYYLDLSPNYQKAVDLMHSKGMSKTDLFNAWKAEFQAQTQDMDFSQVRDELKGVFQLYKGMLDRVPDKGGYEYWLGRLNNGEILEKLALDFAWSAEFQTKAGGTPGNAPTFDQTLTALYKVVLGRDPDAGGYAWWQDYFNQSNDLGRVVTGFTWSPEYESKVDEDVTAWLVTNYGPNLREMDWHKVGFDQAEIDSIKPVGVFDYNAVDGYAGVML